MIKYFYCTSNWLCGLHGYGRSDEFSDSNLLGNSKLYYFNLQNHNHCNSLKEVFIEVNKSVNYYQNNLYVLEYNDENLMKTKVFEEKDVIKIYSYKEWYNEYKYLLSLI